MPGIPRKARCASSHPRIIRVDFRSEFISRDRALVLDLAGLATDRQRLHRGPAQVGGSAQILQRGIGRMGSRQQASDLTTESRWPDQPVTVTTAGRLDLPPAGSSFIVGAQGFGSASASPAVAAGRWSRSGCAADRPRGSGVQAHRVRCEAAVGRVRPHVVVVEPPALDYRTGLGQGGEDLLV